METSKPSPSFRSLRALDALNIVLADVRDGLGPYLAIYLATRHWEADRIGIAMSAMGLAAVAAQAPAGAFIDRTRRKRAAIIVAALAVALGALVMVTWPTFPVILAAQVGLGVATAIFPPAIAAISLGLVGHARFARRAGRNEAFNHAGNVTVALLAGAIGDHVAYEGIFYLLAAMSVATVVVTTFIRRDEIDYDLARGSDGREPGSPEAEGRAEAPRVARIHELLKDRRILIFATSVVLFHFANAAMLPLVGQKLTEGRGQGAAGAMSACIIAAQVVMVPVALLASRLAEWWGRRAVFLIGFAVLPIRGFLYTLTVNPSALVAVQLLDGLGAGIFGVVGVLVIADLTRGTGRFNLMQGALATATGIGASLSNLMTGFIVQAAGYDAGFLTLTAIAAVALLFFGLAMPETLDARQVGTVQHPFRETEEGGRCPLCKTSTGALSGGLAPSGPFTP
jgi:MFS family permease